MSKKYIELEQAIKKIGLIGNLADFIKDVICDELTELPTIEVSEDCISREYILGEAFASDEYNRETKSFDLPVVSVRDIENAPSVVPICQKNRQVERAEGEWKFKKIFPNDDSEFPMGYLVCSVCGSQHANATPCNYCDNCGAKMKG